MSLTAPMAVVLHGRRPAHPVLLASVTGFALAGLLLLALIWDRLPTGSAEWPGSARRAGERAREQSRAEQAADTWSGVLSDSLRCGGDMAVVRARQRRARVAAADETRASQPVLKAAAEDCRRRVPALHQVWLVPASGGAGDAELLAGDAPADLSMLSSRTLSRLREAAETGSETYAVAPGDDIGIDQIVPVRQADGALFILRLRPDKDAFDGMALPHVLDSTATGQGVPIAASRELRVLVAGDPLARQWVSAIAFALLLLATGATIWYSRIQRRQQGALLRQVEIARLATLNAETAERIADEARARVEEANKELLSQVQFREDLQDASPVGLRVIDGQFRIKAVNKAFYNSVGSSSELLLGQAPPYSFWPLEGRDERLRTLKDIVEGHYDVEGYRVVLMRGTVERWTAHVRATRLKGDLGWLLTSEDITGTEQRQAQIDRLRKELLRQGDASIMGERARGLIHDLVQHVRVIDLTSSNLENQDPPLPTPVLTSISRIRQQADCQRQLIANYRQSMSGEPLLEDCDLKTIVADAFALQSHEAMVRGVWLINQVNPQLPMQRLARLNLLQVLVNLVANSLQSMTHTPSVSRRVVVEDRVVPEQPSPLFPSGREWLHVTVDDRGSGIPPDEWEEIFADGKSGREDGQGFGLWISRLWIERMGGRIDVERSSAAGTVMRVVLPFQPLTELPHDQNV